MSKVWLCQDFLAKSPLRVRADVSVYSFEELCFYLYHHAETVEESFFNEMLCQWLDQEIGRTELAQVLSDGLKNEKSGCWCLGQVLTEGGFYTRQEITKAVQLAKTMENKSPAQRAKLRGDRLLRSGKYQDALWEYQNALDGKEDAFFQGKVWHNLGTAYARQFLFTLAAGCYKLAYEIGQQTESSEAYLLALSCRGGHVPGKKDAQLTGEVSRLREMKLSGDRSGYEAKIEKFLLQLRTEYRKSE